ncbi:MAG: response regulator [Ignavibacteriales bacterium]|nr:response regulator [Ignavibacteriales bacterium]
MKILYVDNRDPVRDKMINYLGIEGTGKSIYRADTSVSALDILQKENIDLLLLDEMTLEGDVLYLTSKVSSLKNRPIIILLTNSNPSYYYRVYESSNIDYFFDKYKDLITLKLFLGGLINSIITGEELKKNCC